jgi:hypothetical protein
VDFAELSDVTPLTPGPSPRGGERRTKLQSSVKEFSYMDSPLAPSGGEGPGVRGSFVTALRKIQ